MSVIVFADTRGEKVAKNALETLTYGRKIAAKEGTSLTLVTFGDAPADRLAALDANKVVVARSIGDADSRRMNSGGGPSSCPTARPARPTLL